MVAADFFGSGSSKLHYLALLEIVLFQHIQSFADSFQGNTVDYNPHLWIFSKKQCYDLLQITGRASDKCMGRRRQILKCLRCLSL